MPPVNVMGRAITNDFSWSKSRHEKLNECLRAYYFHYYRSWGGWTREAAAEVRELYTLKKLSNRYTWAGSVVHDAIKWTLRDIQAGRPVDRDCTLDKVHRQMQADYRHSSAKSYWREKHRREFTGLVEHEYGETVSPQEWKQNWDAVKQALTWFFSSHWVELAKGLSPKQWLEVDEEDFDKTVFFMEGVKVFAVPDFAYLDAQGAPVVVDWKTGKAREGYDDQVLGYAVYLSTRYHLPVESVRAQLVYLNEGIEQEVRVDPQAITTFTAHFRKSVGRMRDLLADPAKNVPHSEMYFPMTEDLTACGRCVFRRVCGRESVPAQVA